jgi:hypothetical protein
LINLKTTEEILKLFAKLPALLNETKQAK